MNPHFRILLLWATAQSKLRSADWKQNIELANTLVCILECPWLWQPLLITLQNYHTFWKHRVNFVHYVLLPTEQAETYLKIYYLTHILRRVVKKKRIFYGQADRKGWPPPLTVSCFVFFSEVYIWLLFLIIHDLKQILTKKMFFDPLYDPLVVWRWAFQIEANTTTEPRMQWREVH